MGLIGVLLSISGALYLFKTELNEFLYRSLYYVHQIPNTPRQPLEVLIEKVQQLPEVASVKKVVLAPAPNRSVEVHISKKGVRVVMFVDPYTSAVMGELASDSMFMNKVRKFHSELLLGLPGNLLVELAACTMLLVLLSGTVTLFYRARAFRSKNFRCSLRGRLVAGHVLTGLSTGLLIFFLLISGLPWTGVSGKGLKGSLRYFGQGSPGFGAKFSVDVPEEQPRLPTGSLLQLGEAHPMKGSKEFWFPKSVTDVLTVRNRVKFPEDQEWIRINPYDGTVINHSTWADFAVSAKILAWFMAIHEGRYFGWLNQLLGVVACLGLIVLVVTSLFMIRLRGRDGVINSLASVQEVWGIVPTWLFILVGLLLPLLGCLLLAIWSCVTISHATERIIR